MGAVVADVGRARLVLDSGGLIALARGDVRAREYLATGALEGLIVVVPTIVVLEVLRARPGDAAVQRILARVGLEAPLTSAAARIGATLLERSGVLDLADAIVVVEAIAVRGSRILTSDPMDILALLDAAGEQGRIAVHAV